MLNFIDLIVFSFITFFSNPLSIAFVKAEFYVPLILLISLRFTKSVKVDFITFIFFFFMFVCIASHLLYFSQSLFKDINVLLLATSMLVFVTNIGVRFLESYVKVVYYLTILSIPFWIGFNTAIVVFDLDLVINALKNISYSYSGSERFETSTQLMIDNFRYNFLLFFNFTSNSELFYRNFGYMWEPGQFAAYISYGLIFSDFLKFKFNYNINNKYYYVFYLGLISSFSTAGYLILFYHIIISNITKDILGGKNILGRSGILTNKIPLILIFAVFSIIFASSVDFISGKFLRQFTTDITDYNYYNGRLNFAFMLNEIFKNPLFGSGTYVQLTSELFINMTAKSHNGYIVFARSWGIILFLIMNILVLKSLAYVFQNKIVITMYFIFFILINFSQNLFVQFLPYTVLFFYHFEYLDQDRKIF